MQQEPKPVNIFRELHYLDSPDVAYKPLTA